MVWFRIFEGGGESKVRDMKNKPDGWETTAKSEEDGNIWEMSQREEDILVQEYERRISFTKFKVSFSSLLLFINHSSLCLLIMLFRVCMYVDS